MMGVKLKYIVFIGKKVVVDSGSSIGETPCFLVWYIYNLESLIFSKLI